MGRDNNKLLALGFVGLLGASFAHAQVGYEVSTGIGHSDNINRVEEGAIDETLASAGLVLDWTKTSRRISGDAQVNVSYVEYLEDTYEGEVLGSAAGNLNLRIVPERFHWLFEDTFGQARTDPFEPVTPDNRENVNYFTTGPDFMLRFGPSLSARFFGRYSDTHYEESPLDAQRTSYGASLGREMSERSRVAINVSADESEFEDGGTAGYERRSAFASYELGVGGRTTMNTRLGYSWLQMDGADEDGGLMVDIAVTRQLTPSSVLSFSAGKNFSDAGESLSASGGSGMSEITASADPFESTEAALEWRFQRRRTGFGLGVTYDERSYETQSLFNSKSIYYRADVSRQLRPTLRLSVHATLSNEKFDNGLESDDKTADLMLDWRFGRRIGLQFRVERSERSSSSGTGNYDENRAYLGLTFRGDRAPGAP
jgi:hypothetical protein